MDELTALASGFLSAEDSDHRVSLAIGSVVTLDGPMPDFDSLLSNLGERIKTCPRFAHRLRSHAFDHDAPEWVDDVDFDVARHVKRVSLPSPGDEHELHRLVAEVMAWRMDRSRPLWEIWVMEGLRDGRWAMLLKVHSCIAHAVTIAHIVAGLSDEGIHLAPGGQLDSARLGEQCDVRPSASSLNPITWMRGLWHMSKDVSRLASAVFDLLPSSATTPLNGPKTNLRRYSAARVSLDDVHQVCRVFDVTVADVAVAALTDSYRAYLIRHGHQPSAESLRTLVPGNASAMLALLPVDDADSVGQLRVVHSRLSRARHAGREIGSAANHVPFPVAAWAMRLLTRLPQHSVAAVVTTASGPREPLHILGRRVAAVTPVPPIAMQLRSGVAVLSYAGDLFFGILTDYAAVPDADELARGIESAVRRLVARSKRRNPTRDRKGLSLVVSA